MFTLCNRSFRVIQNYSLYKTELWYLIKLKTATQSYTRNEAMQFMPSYHERGVKMTTETDFEPRPSSSACRWCSYCKGEFPECQWGVDG